MRRMRGFALLALLIALALIGLAAVTRLEYGVQMERRQAEDELLRTGSAMRRAIASYVAATPAGTSAYPATLTDLLRDPRYPQTRRHLRALRADPITGSMQWGLIAAPGGGIAGVYSLSDAAPIKVANFPPSLQGFADRRHYSEWQFAVVTGVSLAPPASADAGVRPQAPATLSN